jgi:DNA polymerase III alpha subunit (gram-positive type)
MTATSGPPEIGSPIHTKILEERRGSSFKRVDLHVHTPGSRDLSDAWGGASAADVVRLAQEASLEVIAVTDHNSVEWCEPVIEAAAEMDLSVLPGVEISTSEGHLLAIFDSSKPIREIRDLLVRVGISSSDWGDSEGDGRSANRPGC